MSAVPRQAEPTGHAGRRLTAAEFLALGQTAERYELVNGVVVMSPSPIPLHQAILAEIVFQLQTLRRAGAAIALFPDTDVMLAPDLVYRPDVSIYAARRMPAIPRQLALAPDLVIEIVSPGSRGVDLVTKREDYERYGVGEYWALDLEPGAAALRPRIFRRQGATMAEATLAIETLESAALPGITLDLAALRRLLAS